MALSTVTSCASVDIYTTDGNGKKNEAEDGIRFYYPKAYLLIRTSVGLYSLVSMTSEIIYLPDRSTPMIAELKSGLSSSKLSISLKDGMLTAIGQETGSVLSESAGTLTALGAYKSSNLVTSPAAKFTVRLYEISVNSAGSALTLAIADSLLIDY